MSRKTYKPYKMKTDPNTKKAIDSAIRDLARGGRAVTSGDNARRLSRSFRDWIHEEKIYFGNCKRHQKSIIAIKPGYKLKVLKNKKVQLKFKEL